MDQGNYGDVDQIKKDKKKKKKSKKDQGSSLRICASCGPKNYLNGFFLAIFERKSISE